MPTVPLFPGLSALAGRYDGFVVDLWGVLHDGVTAFPAAVESLRALRARNKRIVILSNASRRQNEVAARNAQLGIASELSDAVCPPARMPGVICRSGAAPGTGRSAGAAITWGRSATAACARAWTTISSTTWSRRISCSLTGALGTDDRVEDYTALLARARARGLAMICANPDLVVVRGGRREICAGAIALGYEELGGEVRYHGKPHAGIYQACFDFLQVADRRRIAAIGDSSAHRCCGRGCRRHRLDLRRRRDSWRRTRYERRRGGRPGAPGQLLRKRRSPPRRRPLIFALVRRGLGDSWGRATWTRVGRSEYSALQQRWIIAGRMPWRTLSMRTWRTGASWRPRS